MAGDPGRGLSILAGQGGDVHDPLREAVEVDLSQTENVSRLGIGALSALRMMAGIGETPVTLVGATGKIERESYVAPGSPTDRVARPTTGLVKDRQALVFARRPSGA